MKRWISLLALSTLALSGPVLAQAYKCRTTDGRVEISSTPCPSSASTVKTVREEPIPEARRQQAEQEAARMRATLEKHEAAQRAEEAADRERQVVQRPVATATQPEGRSSVDDCLRALDQQALQPMQRAQMEAACRGNTSGQPGYVPVPVPVPVPVYGSNPVAACIQSVERMNLMPAERNRRISQCQGGYTSAPDYQPHRHAPEPVQNANKQVPTKTISCLPGAKNCR